MWSGMRMGGAIERLKACDGEGTYGDGAAGGEGEEDGCARAGGLARRGHCGAVEWEGRRAGEWQGQVVDRCGRGAQ